MFVTRLQTTGVGGGVDIVATNQETLMTDAVTVPIGPSSFYSIWVERKMFYSFKSIYIKI